VKAFRADLHVHTVLSPCAEIEMLPQLIVAEALRLGIDLIAITDHNATANIPAVQQAARGQGLAVLPGMELQTREEVHLLALFDELDQARAFQSIVDGALPAISNDPEHFGVQLVVDAGGEVVAQEERLLLTSADLSINQAVAEIHCLGGLAIPAHVDRRGFGLLEALGFVPPDLPVDALELSRRLTPTRARAAFPQLAGFPLIQDGDVHRLEEFLGSTCFEMEHRTTQEIRLALRNMDGRSFEVICEV
jgi:3',5'-nucleoside bisphosphate phosphatase